MRKLLIGLAVMGIINILAADDSDSLEKIIADAAKQKQSQVLLPKAVYRLDRPLQLKNLNQMSIDGGGSTFLFANPRAGIQVMSCDKLEMANFTLDYAPLPFTQGTVSSIDAAKSQLKLNLHAGYPNPMRLERINLHVFDPVTRNWKVGTPDYFGIKLRNAGNGEYFAEMPKGFEKYVAVGDLVAMDWRSGSAIEIKATRDFRLHDVTIYTAPSIAIIGRFTTGKHFFERVTIKRGPLPEGATEPRLLSAAADALNYAYCENGPDVIGCDFSYQGDDAINFHSVAFPIIKVESPTSILVLRPYPSSEGFPNVIRQGMELRQMDGHDFRVLGRAKLISCEVENGVMPTEKEVSAIFHHYRPERDPSRTVYRLKLETPLDFKEAQFVDIPAISGANFVIRDNYFHDHRARAIRMMASNGVIENNRIERIKQNAITIGGEYAFWREAGWVENLIVRNNTIKDVGQDERLTSTKSYAPAAISLIMRPEDGVTEATSCNRNILIEGNSIDGCSAAGIVVHAVDGAVVRNNKIRNVGYGNLEEAGKSYGFKINSPLVVTPSAINVKLENNILE